MTPLRLDDGSEFNPLPSFSIAVPFDGSDRERRLAEKSIPSAARLGPDEIVVGVDDAGEGGEGAARFITELCEKSRFAGTLNTVRVESPRGWVPQPASAIWQCCRAARNDSVLVFDIRTSLDVGALSGLVMIDKKQMAVVGSARPLPAGSKAEIDRYRQRRAQDPDSGEFVGAYWLHMPRFAGIGPAGPAGTYADMYDWAVAAMRSSHAGKAITLIGDVWISLLDPEWP